MKTASQTSRQRGDVHSSAQGPQTSIPSSPGSTRTASASGSDVQPDSPTRLDDAQADRGPSPTALPAASPTEVILAEKYREATRSHLNHLPALFRSLTGLQCHIIWSSIHPQQWNERELPSRSSLCRRLIKENPNAIGRCRKCARHHLVLALKAGDTGHYFTCFLGAHNFWLPVIVRSNIVGLAYVQTLSATAASPGLDAESSTVTRSRNRPASSKPTRRTCRSARRISSMEFKRVSRLLQLIFRHVESLTVSELRRADLSRTQGALQELQTVATHLRQDLNGLMPPLSKTVPDLQPLSRPERIAQDALKYIHENYTHPITLQTCSSALGLNAAYLSDLFSHRVGLSFKTYLTEVRLEKAKELLADGTMNISQVAAAVGYVSANRFRVAFKAATGSTPKAWRETLRMRH